MYISQEYLIPWCGMLVWVWTVQTECIWVSVNGAGWRPDRNSDTGKYNCQDPAGISGHEQGAVGVQQALCLSVAAETQQHQAEARTFSRNRYPNIKENEK